MIDDSTEIGVGIPSRRPVNTEIRQRLQRGPFLAAFDAGIDEIIIVIGGCDDRHRTHR